MAGCSLRSHGGEVVAVGWRWLQWQRRVQLDIIAAVVRDRGLLLLLMAALWCRLVSEEADDYVATVAVGDNEPEEVLLRRFKREVMRARVIQECKRRQWSEKMQEKKKHKVVVGDDEPEEVLLRRFKREVMRAGVIQECKRRRRFERM
ncbi:hypothetical protein BHE74_00023460 [Ensete ventricosum]|nr:hypothetical protein BHE74_00023460 [Ensete ventricosum]